MIKQIVLDVEFNGIDVDPHRQTKASINIDGKLSRIDNNLRWNSITEAGCTVVSDKELLALVVKKQDQSILIPLKLKNHG